MGNSKFLSWWACEEAPNKLYKNLINFLEAIYVNNINEEQLAEVFQYRAETAIRLF